MVISFQDSDFLDVCGSPRDWDASRVRDSAVKIVTRKLRLTLKFECGQKYLNWRVFCGMVTDSLSVKFEVISDLDLIRVS